MSLNHNFTMKGMNRSVFLRTLHTDKILREVLSTKEAVASSLGCYFGASESRGSVMRTFFICFAEGPDYHIAYPLVP